MVAGIIVGHIFLSSLSTNLGQDIRLNVAIAQQASERIEPNLSTVNATIAQDFPETLLLENDGINAENKATTAIIEINNLEQSR